VAYTSEVSDSCLFVFSQTTQTQNTSLRSPIDPKADTKKKKKKMASSTKEKAPMPRNQLIFDPWNSASTGHQRSDAAYNANSTGPWRAVRTKKLTGQFRGEARPASEPRPGFFNPAVEAEPEPEPDPLPLPLTDKKNSIFTNLTFYINGSTYPLISDRRLKSLLCQHGGCIALGLARRSVTHVILGTQSARTSLAAGKRQKEIVTAGKGVKFVRAEWYVVITTNPLCILGFFSDGFFLVPKGLLNVSRPGGDCLRRDSRWRMSMLFLLLLLQGLRVCISGRQRGRGVCMECFELGNGLNE
jgi:hypothetical protein